MLHFESVNWVSIGWGNDLSTIRREAIIWTNADLLSIGPLQKNSVQFESKYDTFYSWKCIWKCRLKWQPFCPRGGWVKSAPLTHLSVVPHICVNELDQHFFRQWLVAWSVPSHYLDQCWLLVNWSLRNKLQWNSNPNTELFIQEKAFKNVVCEMAAILSRGRWVNDDVSLL